MTTPCPTCGLMAGHANRCYADGVLLSDIRKTEEERDRYKAALKYIAKGGKLSPMDVARNALNREMKP